MDLNRTFKKFKVLTLAQVSKSNECSIRTVQRQFAALAVLRSYNKNSRYYTLPDIPTIQYSWNLVLWGYSFFKIWKPSKNSETLDPCF